jgi:hypothetical protein
MNKGMNRNRFAGIKENIFNEWLDKPVKIEYLVKHLFNSNVCLTLRT